MTRKNKTSHVPVRLNEDMQIKLEDLRCHYEEELGQASKAAVIRIAILNLWEDVFTVQAEEGEV